jgi:hypothetical protein
VSVGERNSTAGGRAILIPLSRQPEQPDRVPSRQRNESPLPSKTGTRSRPGTRWIAGQGKPHECVARRFKVIYDAKFFMILRCEAN